jgi:hypothetical protein
MSIERRLPVGMAEFDQLVNDLKTLIENDVPTITERDIRFIVATSILHLGPLESHKPLEFFYKTILAGASKQVASHVFQDIKIKQKEEDDAAALAASQPKDEIPAV